MSVRITPAALDVAACRLAEALGLEAISRLPIADEPQDDETIGAGLVGALSEGASSQLGYAMGAARPFEFEHRAAFELVAVSGDDATRQARIADAIARAHDAIAADPTLGGLVDYAEMAEPDPTD
ncbi:MAG TPA: hypothetical protein PLS69_09000, partial [Terricaulis sp.]|nr:hypothetical protein [Terricaulis sp.]